jgi:hypothetical protein
MFPPSRSNVGGIGGMMGGACDTKEAVVAQVFMPSCGSMAGCHAPPIAFGIFVEDPASLIDKPPITACSEMKLINPALPPSGVIFEKVSGTACPGEQMPPADSGIPRLTDTQVTCLRDWVTAEINRM